MKMKLHAELIFMWKVSHLDSFWNRGTRNFFLVVLCLCCYTCVPHGLFSFSKPTAMGSLCHLLNRTPSVFPRVSGGSLTMLPMSLIWAILCIYWSVTPRIPCVYNYPRTSPRSFAIAFSAHLVSVPLRSCLALTLSSFPRALLPTSPCISI